MCLQRLWNATDSLLNQLSILFYYKRTYGRKISPGIKQSASG